METLTTSPSHERLPSIAEGLSVGVIYNPASAQAKRVRSQLLDLIGSGCVPPHAIYATVPGGLEANAPGFAKLLAMGSGRRNEDGTVKPLDAIVVLSGDGLLLTFENFLAGQAANPDLPQKTRDNILKTVIIPVANGGASDKAKTQFPHGIHLRDLGGLPIEHHIPMRIETTRPDGETTVRRTTLYDSKGPTAKIAEYLNKPWRRNPVWNRIPGGKHLSMYLAGVLGWFGTPRFPVVIEGQEHSLRELIVSNNPRMGGFNRFPGDARENSFFVLAVEAGRKFARLRAIGQLLLNKSRWQEHKEIEFTIGNKEGSSARFRHLWVAVPSQSAGETEARLSRGTHVRITKIGEHAIRYASGATA